MVKDCLICGNEFVPDKISQKYCSEDCRLERNREADKLRKRAARAEEKAKREKEKQRIQQKKKEDMQKAELERQKVRELEQQRLKRKAKLGNPKARMKLAKPFSAEYWKAYQDYEKGNIPLQEAKTVRYVNGISVYDDNFVENVMFLIEQDGVIYTDLKRNLVLA